MTFGLEEFMGLVLTDWGFLMVLAVAGVGGLLVASILDQSGAWGDE